MTILFCYSRCTVITLVLIYCGIVHCRNINDGKPNQDCPLHESSIYKYTDNNDDEIILPHTVDDGSNVTVTCIYPSIYAYDDVEENDTITCTDGTFSNVSIYCNDSPEQNELPNPCEQFVLRNGQVSHNELGEYHVICNIGYNVNLPLDAAYRPCECTEGELRCFAGIKPVCKADTCKIPFDTDKRLSIYQLPNRIYLSEGEVVEDGSYVFFNCSNVEEQKYEPANRRFKCKFGRWKEAERNRNWNFGNNGKFPECREAMCDPPCENGGVCYRDGQCRCQHMTSGERCETLLCVRRCIKNGGECIRPGVCGNCPVYRHGDNCEIAIKCNKIENLYGGDVIYFENREVGTEVFYSCEDGYTQHPEEQDSSTCTWTGKEAVWLPDPPICLETALIQTPNNGYTDTDDVIVEHDHSYNIFCNQGYEFYRGGFLDKATITITNHNGTLKPKVPGCKPARCDQSLLNETIVTFRNGTEITDLVPSNTPVLYSCIPGYRFRNKNLGERVARKCFHGEFVRVPRCIPKPCTIGKLKLNSYSNLEYYPDSYSFLFPGFDVIHGAIITVSCRNYRDYELFVESTTTYISEFISVCDYGTFDKKDEEFPVCLEKRCHFEMPPEYCFWKNDTSRDNCYSGDFYVDSRTNMNIGCSDGYTQIIDDVTKDDPTTSCLYGEYTDWTPFVCSPLPCAVPELGNGHVLHTKSEVASSSNVTYKCNEGYHFTETPHKAILESMCYLSEWMPAIPRRCQPDSCLINVTHHTVYTIMESTNNITSVTSSSLVPHGAKLSIKCEEGYDMFDQNKTLLEQTNGTEYVTCGSGTWSNVNVFKNVCHERCVIPDGGRYLYINTEGTTLSTGDLVTEGETLNVTCTNLDDYIYDNYDVDDEMYTVTCNNGSLSKPELECSEDKSDECLVLDNGFVEMKYGSYNVTCNAGYTLNLNPQSVRFCKCNRTTGVLSCFNKKPVCRPDDCTLPRNYDMQDLSVKADGVDLTAGTIVSHGKHMIFDCQQHGGDLYEPKNRSYVCDAGRWIVERTGHTNWKYGNTGDFPKCKRVLRNCTIPQRIIDNDVLVSNIDGESLYTEVNVAHGEWIEIDCGVKTIATTRLITFVCKDGNWQQQGDTTTNMVNDGRISNCSVINGIQVLDMAIKQIQQASEALHKKLKDWF